MLFAIVVASATLLKPTGANNSKSFSLIIEYVLIYITSFNTSLTNPSGFGNGNSFIAQAESSNGQFEKIEVEFVADFDAYYAGHDGEN